MEQTIETLSVRVDKLEKDTEELFEKINMATVTLAAVNEKLSAMLTTLGEVKQAVATLQSRPGRFWDAFMNVITAAVVSGLVGYFIAKVH